MNNKSKVLFLQNCGRPTTKIKKEISTLKSLGMDVQFLGWDRYLQYPVKEESDSVKYLVIKLPAKRESKVGAFFMPLWWLISFLWIIKIKPDIIHAADFEAGFPATFYSILKNKPLIYDVLDTFYMRYNFWMPVKWILQKLENWVMKKATKIILVDENRITETERQYLNKTSIIYNSPPDLKDWMNIKGDDFILFTSGLLNHNRGLNWILDAFEKTDNTKLFIAGKVFDNNLKHRLHTIHNIKFLGELPYYETLKLYGKVDVVMSFYNPANEINRRASSNKLFDAMMAGKPVIVNKELYVSKLVEENDIGYTIPYGDTDALVKLWEHIRVNPEEAKEKGNRGRYLYINQYSWKEMKIRLENIYNEFHS